MTALQDRLEAARRVHRAMRSSHYRRLVGDRTVVPMSLDDPLEYLFAQLNDCRRALVVSVDDGDRDVWVEFRCGPRVEGAKTQPVAPQSSYGMLLDLIRHTDANSFELRQPEIAFSMTETCALSTT